MRLSVVTPTGDRPEAFALCETWMGRQTLAPHEWLVYCDGAAPTRVSRGQTLIRCPEMAGRGSLVRKIRDALARATGDAIVIVEDDDWYAPDWLAWCAAQLEEIVFTAGAHTCRFCQNGRWHDTPRKLTEPECWLLHCSHLGPIERMAAKLDAKRARLSPLNVQRGWGNFSPGLQHAQEKRALITSGLVTLFP